MAQINPSLQITAYDHIYYIKRGKKLVVKYMLNDETDLIPFDMQLDSISVESIEYIK